MANNISITGNLTRDSEVKSYNDQTFLKFTLADNIRGEHTNFFDVVYFNKGADKLEPFCKKGMQLTVMGGTLKISKKKMDDGKEFTNISVSAREIVLPPKPKSAEKSESKQTDMIDDEIPF